MRAISVVASLFLCLRIAVGAAAGARPPGSYGSFKLAMQLGGGRGTLEVIAHPDGKVTAPGRTIARIAGDSVADTSGRMLLKIDPDGSLRDRRGAIGYRFNEHDEMALPGGKPSIRLSPGGDVELAGANGFRATGWKAEGVDDSNRRMALMLAFLLFDPKLDVPEIREDMDEEGEDE